MPTQEKQFRLFFRKKSDPSPQCSDKDRTGWALTETGEKVPVFRSHVNGEWLTYEEFESEKMSLRQKAAKFDGLMFTTRKGFVLATPVPGTLAWKYVSGRRVQYLFTFERWIRYSRSFGLDTWA